MKQAPYCTHEKFKVKDKVEILKVSSIYRGMFGTITSIFMSQQGIRFHVSMAGSRKSLNLGAEDISKEENEVHNV